MTPPDRQALARRGEDLAAEYYRSRKYRILARNYRTRLGEIDLVAEKNGTLVFAEVKARSSRRFGEPEEAVTGAKKRRLMRVAECYLLEKGLAGAEMRFDVLSIMMNAEGLPLSVTPFEGIEA